MLTNIKNSPSWPPDRRRIRDTPQKTPSRPTTFDPSIPYPCNTSDLPATPLPSQTPRKIYQNGFEATPKAPAYKPYTIIKKKGRHRPLVVEGPKKLQPVTPLSGDAWRKLVEDKAILGEGRVVKDFQMSASNFVLQRAGDLCVVAPTGAGKSLLWVLPLYVQTFGISLVIIPYKSLGFQGVVRHHNTLIRCSFLRAKGQRESDLEGIASGTDMQVVYACPEILETPAIAHLLHSPAFRDQLSAVYIDEAHIAHDSASWRPSYTRLRLLRDVVGPDIPLVCISATLPSRCRRSLERYASLSSNPSLINLGNFRPELSLIIRQMAHPASSFQDLTWVLPSNTCISDPFPQTLIYCDDLDLLTEMFFWFRSRLAILNLPTSWVDILHAGLSDTHQETSTPAFIDQTTRILLGSEKIGAGMDFPHVKRVAQYRTRKLTIERLEQRRGRGARLPGTTAIGVVMVEPSMYEEGLSVDNPKLEDPALLNLIHATECYQIVIDRWLENPPRSSPSSPCTTCSFCNPTLLSITLPDLQWIMEDPASKQSVDDLDREKLTDLERKEIRFQLAKWRIAEWRDNWEEEWPRYGPEDIICDSDLEKVAASSLSIRTSSDIYKITRIVHWEQLANPFFSAVHAAVLRVCNFDICAPRPQNSIPAVHADAGEMVSGGACDLGLSVSAQRKRKRGPGTLDEVGEFILEF